MKKYVILLLINILILSNAKAQLLASENINVEAYVDTYYAYDFSEPLNKDRPYVTQAVRHNEFNINWAFIRANYENENIRASVGLQTGTYVQTNYAAEPNDLTRMLYNTYAGYKITEGVWIDAGIFGGHTGYESPLSIENEVYTRALATEYTPYYQAGVRLTAALSEKVTLTGVLLNGWQIIAETNDAKSYGFNINFALNDQWEVNYGNLLGNEGTLTTGSKYRIYNHFYIKHSPSEQFHLMLSLDHGMQEAWNSDETANFFFATFLGGWQISQKIDLGFRYEYVTDDNEILIATDTGEGFNNHIGSVSLNFRPMEQFAIRSELRVAGGEDFIYTGEEGLYKGASQFIVGMALKL